MPYLGAEPTAHHGLNVFKYVSTNLQTNFTGADAEGAVLSYDIGDGSCQVWLNGIKLDRSDVVATDGSSVTLAACATGDIIHIQAVKALTVGDVVPASTGGTFSGAVVAAAGATVPSGQTLTIARGATIANSGTATGFPATDLTAIADGSVGSPSLANSGDTNTGIYWPGADQLGLTTAGAAGLLIDAAGIVTKPLQPAFSAIVSTTITNVTGDSTAYTVIFNSEEFDTNGDFDTSTGLFTAPVAGVYSFTAGVAMFGITSSHTSDDIFIKDNTDNWYGNKQNLYATATAAGYRYITLAATFYMAASDTAGVELRIYNGAQVVDVLGQSYPTTWFGGCLLA